MKAFDMLNINDDERHWFDNAACVDAPKKVFFATNKNGQDKAKKFCKTCPVVEECLEWAFKTYSWYGVFGGKTAYERKKMINERMMSWK